MAKLPKDAVSDPVRLVQRSSSVSDSASFGGTSKQYPDRTGRPPAAAAAAVAVGGMEGVAKKKNCSRAAKPAVEALGKAIVD